jgi:peptidoglycan/LPS O-acetylase OafA/YrhL
MAESNQGRVFYGSLESLRGVAALLVGFYHVAWLNPAHDAGIVRNSYLMVDLFFVLSGFVMCHGYGDRIRNRHELGEFFVLRLGRLYPLHLIVLLVFLAAEAARYGAQHWLKISSAVPAFAENTGWALLSNLFLVHSLGLHNRLTFNAPSWSISAEFYTYIAFAVVVLALRKWQKPAQLAAFVTLSALSLGLLLWHGRPDLNVMYDFGWFRCTMSFFAGAASHIVFGRSEVLRRGGLRRVVPYIAVACLVGGALFLEFKTKGPSDFLFPPLVVILVVALAASPHAPINRWLQLRPLVYLGRISYSIYMVHYLLSWQVGSALVSWFGYRTSTTGAGEQAIQTGALAGTVALLVYLGSVLLVSRVTFAYIEEPFRQKTKAWVATLKIRHAASKRAPQEDPLLVVPLS